MKTLKERDDLDLLELVCQLHCRSVMHISKEMHDASIEARKELESRIVAYQNIVKANVIKSVCPQCWGEGTITIRSGFPLKCHICNGTGQTVL